MEDYFARQQASVQAALQRLQRRVGADPAKILDDDDADDLGGDQGDSDKATAQCAASHWAAASAAADKERAGQLADVELLLNGGGRICRPDFAGACVQRTYIYALLWWRALVEGSGC